MVRKRSPTNKDMQPPRIDDLKRIKGISLRIEKKLNDSVGCFTFAQLSAMTPADIAEAVVGLADLSRERIIKQDWIGQARKLAAGEAELPVEVPTPAESPVTIESVEITTQGDIPEQVSEWAAETSLEVAHEESDAPATPEQDASFTTPVELPIAIEHVPSALSPVEPETDAMPPTQPYHPVTFTAEFLLDEHNNVGSTHIQHKQSGHELTWAGWQNTKLVDFMIESAALQVPLVESTLPVDEEPEHSEEPEPTPAIVSESEPLTSSEEKVGLTGIPRLRELEIIRVDSNVSRRALAVNEPFDVRLTLDLNELKIPGGSPLDYKASIYGRSRGRPGLVVGEVQGSLVSTGTITIKVGGNPLLVEGIYKLAAQVIVGLPGDELKVRPGTTSVIDGGEVLVY